ncbi:hypothetical protein G7054_g7196 [Neopestalotiopsis clavispora]|nr:hypothetical protein G7054_g7196 [Neopestalotiopsis clavispora]
MLSWAQHDGHAAANDASGYPCQMEASPVVLVTSITPEINMSGVELLGFACSIMQVISFSREVISLCSNVYQGKHPDAELARLAASLHTVSSGVQMRFDTLKPKTVDEKGLCDIATRCAIAARDLEEEVSFITSRQKQGSLASTLRIAAKTTWRKRRLDRLEKSLQEHERVLDTHLMARVCKQTDAIELKQKEGFEKLGADMQHFVSQYALGHERLHKLVQSDIRLSQRSSEKSIKAHVTEEITRSQAAVFGHIDSQAEMVTKKATRGLYDLNIQANNHAACERLLQSLKYSAMNERRNHLTESHRGTFEWIFSQHELTDDDGSDDNNNVNNNDGGEYSHDEVSETTVLQDPPWDDFEDWLKSDSDIYWISGKPGSGKSTLMKFLMSNPKTEEALQAWRRDVVIISHFFWKPGSMIQRNVRGLFASLLHQLLTIRQEVLHSMLTSSRDLRRKESDTDWSLAELHSLCLSTLKSYPSSICIFLDGLDEICDEDGVHVLMETVDKIKTTVGVKICVASRPEQRFKLYLSQIPQLKVHDLTSGDMKHYADQVLRPVWSRRQDLSRWTLDEEILPQLVSKAQGVFLWTSLAVKSLISGLENDDSSADLVLRLQELPTELSQMYADMWMRLNKNTKVHRESTARLLNLIVAYRELINHTHEKGWGTDPPHLIKMMGATELCMQKKLLFDGQRPATEAVELACIRTQRLIEARCIGLVESKQVSRDEYCQCEASLITHTALRFDFIHRTAYDFLTDSEEGRHILSYDPSSEGERYLQWYRGLLVELAITQRPWHLPLTLAKLARASHFVPQKMIDDLLKISWKLYNRNIIDCIRFDGIGDKPHFLEFMLFSEFHDFLVATIKKSSRPSILATEVLQNMAATRNFVKSPETSKMFDLLVSLGADPVLRGRSYGSIGSEIGLDGSSLALYWSAVQGTIFKYFDFRFSKSDSSNYFTNPSPQKLMQLYKDQNAAFSERLAVSITVDHEECSLDFGNGIGRRHYKFIKKAQDSMKIAQSFRDVTVIFEATSAFLLEVVQMHQKGWCERNGLLVPPESREDQLKDYSAMRIRYLLFARSSADSINIFESRCRVRDQESVQHIEQLIQSWLFGEIWDYPGIDLWNALTQVADDFEAGSRSYERVYGSILAYFADEGVGYCKIPKAEIDQRGQHMREENPDAPGHWL